MKRDNGLTKRMWIPLILTLFMTACVDQRVQQTALCEGTETDRKAHARALLQSPHEPSRQTGAVVLAKIRNGCDESVDRS